MLRISELEKSKKQIIFKLEGKIAGLWVSELEKLCKKYLEQMKIEIVFDLSDVSYISDDGINFLISIKNRIKILNAQPYINLCLKKNGFTE